MNLLISLLYFNNATYSENVDKLYKKIDLFSEVLEKIQNEYVNEIDQAEVMDSAINGVSPGICHQVAREEFVDIGAFIQATDSHTCMGGVNNSLAYGVGATEYASLIYSGFTFVKVPESIRFELIGKLNPGCTAKDVML